MQYRLLPLALCALTAPHPAQVGQPDCWALEAELTSSPSYFLGGSVALSGDTLLVSNEWSQTGARVYVRDGPDWSLQQELLPSTPILSSSLDHAVAIEGDLAVFTNARDDEAGSNAGAAFVFRRSGETWTEEAKLLASDAGDDTYFGESVVIDAGRIVVSAPSSGAVYVFEEQGGSWVETHRIPRPAISYFGFALALDGDTLVAGGPLSSFAGQAGNAVHVFVFDGVAWGLEQTLFTPSLAVYYPASVALEGDVLAVGAYSLGFGNEDEDAAYVYERTAGAWDLAATVTPAPGTGRFYGYGRSVALDGGRLAVGATDNAGGLQEPGRVFLYELDGGAWTLQASLAPPPPLPSDGQFGYSVALAGGTLVAGDPWAATSFHFRGGMAWVFATDPALAPLVGYRNAGSNPVSFAAGQARLGETLRLTVAPAMTGHAQALVIGFDSPGRVTLAGGQVLLCLDGGSGELLNTGFRPGPFATFDVPVPHDLDLLGAGVCAQAVHALGVPGFALSNAQDLSIGPPSAACP